MKTKLFAILGLVLAMGITACNGTPATTSKNSSQEQQSSSSEEALKLLPVLKRVHLVNKRVLLHKRAHQVPLVVQVKPAVLRFTLTHGVKEW